MEVRLSNMVAAKGVLLSDPLKIRLQVFDYYCSNK
jgi:hypothetical protein